jgi:hypothetical protein
MRYLFLFAFILFSISNNYAQVKWKEHLGDYHPYVELKADFPLNQSFPYNHKLKPTLTVPSLGRPEISIIEGQVLNKETVSVQFGPTGNIEEWKIEKPEDGSSDYFFIVDEREFKRRLRNASILRVTVLLYQNGEQTIYFSTSGFKL